MSIQTQPNQESFNAGEFGERMAARLQFEKSSNAGALMENMLPLPQGGLSYRPGTRYIADVKDHTVRSFLISFSFSTTQSYCIELGAQVARFFKDQASIVALDIGASITNGTFNSNTSGWTAAAGSLTHDATNNRMQISASGGRAQQSVATSSANVEPVVHL